jgi:hypothetical protein
MVFNDSMLPHETPAVVGGGMDAAGQLTDPKGESYRPWQTASNALTGAIALPLGGKSWWLDGLLGATTNATNTVVTNAAYGRTENVPDAAIWGGVFSAAGNKIGSWAEDKVSKSVSSVIYPNGINPQASILFQGVQNPLSPPPDSVNTATSTLVGGIPSLAPDLMRQLPSTGGMQP